MSNGKKVSRVDIKEKNEILRQTKNSSQAVHNDKNAVLILQDFGERTSFHILGRISEASKIKTRGSVAKSYVFFIIFLISLTWSVKSVYEIGSDYFTYPTTTNVEKRPLKEIPALTVCLGKQRLGPRFVLQYIYLYKIEGQYFFQNSNLKFDKLESVMKRFNHPNFSRNYSL